MNGHLLFAHEGEERVLHKRAANSCCRLFKQRIQFLDVGTPANTEEL